VHPDGVEPILAAGTLHLTPGQVLPSVPGDRVDERRWKFGELAAATGVTVRTLHHFDAIGLLRPSSRTAAGHRLYTGGDVRRLYRVLALRQLGIPLAEIGGSLRGDDLTAVVTGQLAEVERRLAALRRLRQRLGGLVRDLQDAREPSIDELVTAMEVTMEAGYFTPEQLAAAKARHREPGFAETFARWQRDAGEVVTELGEYARSGTDPADPGVQQLAHRWQGMVREMGSPSAVYARIEGKGPEAATRGILTAEVWEYLRRAFAAGFGG
jgi:DNA-binding transcriptional MerR regulator